MSGILETTGCGQCKGIGDRRNTIASALAGGLFFSGWWILFDLAAQDSAITEFRGVYCLCGIVGTLAFFMINCVTNNELRGEMFSDGCMGPRGSRLWMFVGLVMSFSSLIASAWIFFAGYLTPFRPVWYYGLQGFLHNLFIFSSAFVYRFGRSELLWG